LPRHLLTERMVKQAKPGVLIDGAGLRLKVSVNARTGTLRRSWVLRTTVKNGRVRELGLGSAEDVSLKEARERAQAARKLAHDGVDPLAARSEERRKRAAEAARAMTFKQCAEACIAALSPGWRNEKHAAQWKTTLQTYAYPVMGNASVQAIDVAMVMKVLEPIWPTKTETASRVRQRIEVVLDWAGVRGYRQGDNPARWRGHLDRLLPARTKVQRVQHHAAMPYADVPAFVVRLREEKSEPARALLFLLLTAARSSEVIKATWREVDLKAGVWLIPGERMKAGRDHRVPLDRRTIEILRQKEMGKKEDLIFSGARAGKSLSATALSDLLERTGGGVATVHGFRSTFRDWAAEKTNFAREVAEGALAHVIADKVEAAYRRTDLFEKRRLLMEAWSDFCASDGGATRRF
jgi:integrase